MTEERMFRRFPLNFLQWKRKIKKMEGGEGVSDSGEGEVTSEKRGKSESVTEKG